MKLFTRYNRVNLVVTITIFLVGSCIFYLVLHYIFINQIDEMLVSEQEEVMSYASKYGKLPEIINTDDQYTIYRKEPMPATISFSNVYIKYGRSEEWSRQIKFGVSISGVGYTVTVSKPLEETENLLRVVILVTIFMIALILLAGYLINRAVLTKLWQPFYQTISFIRDYDVDANSQPKFGSTKIDEFDLLNENISAMTRRVEADFQSLKEFTGYAAHEMQTPLAIIRTRLELILQNEALLKKNAEQVGDIENAVRKLSRLYQSLLLLTKIENGQFSMGEIVSLDELLNTKVDEIAELASAKGLQIEFLRREFVSIRFHGYLADIVVGNLLNNAVRYNKRNGWVGISLTANALSISNTSDLGSISSEDLFRRFFRDPEIKEEGNGLGLVIVKRICEAGGYRISYDHSEGRHTFTIHL